MAPHQLAGCTGINQYLFYQRLTNTGPECGGQLGAASVLCSAAWLMTSGTSALSAEASADAISPTAGKSPEPPADTVSLADSAAEISWFAIAASYSIACRQNTSGHVTSYTTT